MPIESSVAIVDLSTEEFGKLDYQVMSHVFASQNAIGRLADEVVYHRDLENRLRDASFRVMREVGVTARFDDFVKTYWLDLLVADQAVYELKAVTVLNDWHQAQLLNYLLMLDLAHGKLINFKSGKVDSRFVNNAHSRQKRQSFDVIADENKGHKFFRELVVNLLRDWGTGLSVSLYQQTLMHLLGGEEKVLRPIPMKRATYDLGHQRFAMVEDGTAFRLTAFSDTTDEYKRQLHKLLAHSTLDQIEWVNVSIDRVEFATIQK
jgi:GxxExxY protein